MNEDVKRTYKAFPLIWSEIEKHDNDVDKFRPLTERQSAILLAAIEHYRWPTRWQELGISAIELEKEIAEIQDRLMREDGAMSMDYDQLEIAIKNAIYKATNDVAKQIVSGVTTGFVVNEDGTVSSPTDDPATDLPTDDPATDLDESLAAKQGGVINVRKYLQQVCNDMAAWHFAGVTQLNAALRLADIYGFDGTALTDYVAYYYTSAVTPNTPATIAASIDGTLFCRGVTNRSISYYIYNQHATAGEITELSLLNDCITQEILSGWFETGTDTPSTLYKENSCVPSPTETIYMPLLGTTYNGQQSWKPNHRLLVTVKNHFTDNLGNQVDFWWYDAVGVTLPVNRIATVSIQLGAGITKPTVNQVPFKSSHIYQFTLDTPSASGSIQITVPSTGMTAPITASIVGVGFEVTIQDLGEIGI